MAFDATAARDLKKDYEENAAVLARRKRSMAYYTKVLAEAERRGDLRKSAYAKHKLSERIREVEHIEAALLRMETRAIEEAWQ